MRRVYKIILRKRLASIGIGGHDLLDRWRLPDGRWKDFGNGGKKPKRSTMRRIQRKRLKFIKRKK